MSRRLVAEDDLKRTVLEMCAAMGLRTAHFRPALTKNGWRTPVEGDGEGFPDLVVVGRAKVLWRELKCDGENPTREQQAWLADLARAGADAGVWWPADLRTGRILAELLAAKGGS